MTAPSATRSRQPAVRHAGPVRRWHGTDIPLDARGRLLIPTGPACARPRRAARPKGLAGRELVAWSIEERDLLAWVQDVLRSAKFAGQVWSYHAHRSDRDAAGFPDLMLMSHHGVMWRELKRVGERPTREQAYVLAQLEDHGHNTGVWTPAHRLDGTIIAELTGLATGRNPA